MAFAQAVKPFLEPVDAAVELVTWDVVVGQILDDLVDPRVNFAALP